MFTKSKKYQHFILFGLVFGILALTATVTLTQESWFPSEWGADDRRGAVNRLTPEKVLEAASLIKAGEVYQLGRVYESGIPVFGTRHYSLRIPAMSGPLGENKTTWFEEIFSGEIGQIGTQFDGLGHIGIGDLYYNGLDQRDFAKAEGLAELGVENVGPIVTRGVLIDVAGYKGVEHLGDNYEITRADLEGALKNTRVSRLRLAMSLSSTLAGVSSG